MSDKTVIPPVPEPPLPTPPLPTPPLPTPPLPTPEEREEQRDRDDRPDQVGIIPGKVPGRPVEPSDPRFPGSQPDLA